MTSTPGNIPTSLWQRITETADLISLNAGELLWTPGEDRIDKTYFVISGMIRLYHPNKKGKAITVIAIGAGGMLGFHPTLKGSPYATGAEVLVKSQIYSLDNTYFDAWLKIEDYFKEELESWLIADLNMHLLDTYTRLGLEQSSARERVARLLLSLDRLFLISYMTRQNLADLSNLTNETVVRTISAFVKEGILENSKFTALTEGERYSLTTILSSVEPMSLPYS